MGLKEKLIVDWKGQIIEYQNVEFYVVDQFEYKDRLFLYVIDTNIEDNVVKLMFLQRKKDDVFSHVDNKSELYKELIKIASGRLTATEITKQIEEFKNKG